MSIFLSRAVNAERSPGRLLDETGWNGSTVKLDVPLWVDEKRA